MNINLTLVLNVITFFILLFLLQRFVFRYVLEMIEKRKDYIRKSLDDIEKLKAEFSQDRAQAQKELNEAKRHALTIKEEAIKSSEEYKERKEAETKKELERLKDKSQEEINFQVEKAKQDLKDYSLTLSFKIAEKILQSEVDEKKHNRILEESIKELDEKGYDNN